MGIGSLRGGDIKDPRVKFCPPPCSVLKIKMGISNHGWRMRCGNSGSPESWLMFSILPAQPSDLQNIRESAGSFSKMKALFSKDGKGEKSAP